MHFSIVNGSPYSLLMIMIANMNEVVRIAKLANGAIVVALVGFGECLCSVNIYNLVVLLLWVLYLLLKLHLNLCFFFVDYSQLCAQNKRACEKPFIFIEFWDCFLGWLRTTLAFRAKWHPNINFAASLQAFELQIVFLTVRRTLMFVPDGMHVSPIISDKR